MWLTERVTTLGKEMRQWRRPFGKWERELPSKKTSQTMYRIDVSHWRKQSSLLLNVFKDCACSMSVSKRHSEA